MSIRGHFFKRFISNSVVLFWEQNFLFIIIDKLRHFYQATHLEKENTNFFQIDGNSEQQNTCCVLVTAYPRCKSRDMTSM